MRAAFFGSAEGGAPGGPGVASRRVGRESEVVEIS